MYKLSVESQFSAAHRLLQYPGACKRIHGHNWKVKTQVSAAELNELGMVIDLLEMQKLLDDCLMQFDHQMINDIEPFDRINPTSENLARYIFQQIKEKLPERIKMESVEVLETDGFSVIYEE